MIFAYSTVQRLGIQRGEFKEGKVSRDETNGGPGFLGGWVEGIWVSRGI